MSKGEIEIVEVMRGQNSASVEVKFYISEDCGNPISNFSKIFDIPIDSSTTDEEIRLAALDKARDFIDKEYPV